MDSVLQIQLELAKKASRTMLKISTEQKNQALTSISYALKKHVDEIIAANQIDIDNAKANGMSSAMVDRLLLTQQRIENIAEDVLK